MPTEAHQIAETLPAVTDRTDATGSNAPSTPISVFTAVDFDHLPKRLNDTQLAQVEAIASARLPVMAAADDKFIAGCLRALAVMPRRADDDTTGAVRAKMYQRHLTGFAPEALTYMVDEAIRSLKFFPSIAECRAILNTWPNYQVAARQQARAKVRAGRERTERMHEALRSLRQGDIGSTDLAGWPEGWLRVAATQNIARQDEDGTWHPKPDPWFVQQRQESML